MCAQNHEGNVLIVSSGGPIATAVGHVLGTTPETTIELNMRIRNSAVTEFAFTPKRHTLLSLQHPAAPGRARTTRTGSPTPEALNCPHAAPHPAHAGIFRPAVRHGGPAPGSRPDRARHAPAHPHPGR